MLRWGYSWVTLRWGYSLVMLAAASAAKDTVTDQGLGLGSWQQSLGVTVLGPRMVSFEPIACTRNERCRTRAVITGYWLGLGSGVVMIRGRVAHRLGGSSGHLTARSVAGEAQLSMSMHMSSA